MEILWPRTERLVSTRSLRYSCKARYHLVHMERMGLYPEKGFNDGEAAEICDLVKRGAGNCSS